jgi:AcrR family transcriptional regulator
MRLFREQGYQATTVEQIIDAAEVSETTFFRYFPTKEDVVLRADLGRPIVELLRAQPRDLPPVAAVRAAFREFFAAQSAEQRSQSRERQALVMTEPPLRAAALDHVAQTLAPIAAVLADRAGLPRDDLAARTIAGAVTGVTMAAMAHAAADPAGDLPPTLDQALAHLESGLTLSRRPRWST